MRYAQIRELDVTNGENVGVALFVQGCHFHCKNCFNPETWDFNGGKEFTQSVREQFLHLASRPYIKRISFLGGEPLAPENRDVVASLIKELKETYPDKKIWVYTGYKCSEVIQMKDIMDYADYAVTGPYDDELKDVGNRITKWAGSLNQIILDIRQSVGRQQFCQYKG